MPSRLKVLLAVCCVGGAALAAYAWFGGGAAAAVLAAGLLGLLLGAWAAAGQGDARGRSGGAARAAEAGGAGTVEPEEDGAAASSGAGGGRARADARAADALAADALAADALLKATMDGMREGVLVVDQSMRVVASNRAARAVFGRAEEVFPARARPAAGEPLSTLTRDPSIHAAYRAALEQRRDEQVKVELLGAERRVFELRVAPLLAVGAGPRLAAIGVFFDITRLERLERVRQEFLSNVSHELRTPLTSILAFVETLEGGALDSPAEARRFVAVIRKNAERMRTLVEDILELSAIESGETRVEPREVRLRPAVREALGALAAKAEARGVTLANEVSPEAVVWADPRRLEQMLLNLVDNAIKFNRAGGVVSVGHERAGGRDRVSVSDTGEGVAPEHLPRIFERFYRADPARSREAGGTGLGLAIVKHLARAHGGEVSARSDPNGSTFTVELPRAD